MTLTNPSPFLKHWYITHNGNIAYLVEPCYFAYYGKEVLVGWVFTVTPPTTLVRAEQYHWNLNGDCPANANYNLSEAIGDHFENYDSILREKKDRVKQFCRNTKMLSEKEIETIGN